MLGPVPLRIIAAERKRILGGSSIRAHSPQPRGRPIFATEPTASPRSPPRLRFSSGRMPRQVSGARRRTIGASSGSENWPRSRRWTRAGDGAPLRTRRAGALQHRFRTDEAAADRKCQCTCASVLMMPEPSSSKWFNCARPSANLCLTVSIGAERARAMALFASRRG
jgi:hypothetical protein